MKYILLISLFALTACAQVGANNQLNAVANKESGGWKNVALETSSTCPQGTDEKPLPKSLSIKQYDCWAGLVEKYVRPVAFNHEQLNNYMLSMRKVSVAYKKGQVDRDAARTQAMENWNKYISNLDQIAQGVMFNAQQQDQRLSQGLAQMSNQANQMEMQKMQSMNANRPRTTNCNAYGNSLNCTTW